MWKANIVTKNPDGTFVVTHESAQGSLPYHVCSRDIDPANLYDIAEVSAFWESLPDTDPRKQVHIEPEPEPDMRSPAEKREDAYAAEADPIFREAMFYQTEAEGLYAAEDFDAAVVFEAKSTELKKQYAIKKAEIRQRFPDEEE